MITKTIKSAVAQLLRDDIIRGTFRPGERLRLETLTERYGVSMTPIREAMTTLQSEGIVTILPHKGAQVTEFSPREIRELFEMRATLERLATLRAVPFVKKRDVQALQKLVDQMNELHRHFDMVEYSRLNLSFHLSLYGLSGYHHLQKTIEAESYRVMHYMHTFTDVMPFMKDQDVDHQTILNLAARHQAEEAADKVHQHVLVKGMAIANQLANP
ncbi:GntR family transcriptional regulator [Deinococcus roseus]|uniref:GntR family transcriptional regulator n=1 Tax=Deinococcus roseus TaxID=392414 RepID=A0ABQ2DL22_9DEIO|nr:GntR family transcriptional regulator [Deinococcus roseus]GGJ58464.1 GntR family transcriptional regulator [Deinococcus roseus]